MYIYTYIFVLMKGKEKKNYFFAVNSVGNFKYLYKKDFILIKL